MGVPQWGGASASRGPSATGYATEDSNYDDIVLTSGSACQYDDVITSVNAGTHPHNYFDRSI